MLPPPELCTRPERWGLQRSADNKCLARAPGAMGIAPLFYTDRERWSSTSFSTTLGIRQGRDVPQLLVLARRDLAQDAPHDLARAGLRQAGDDLDAVRRGDRRR